MSTRSDLPQRLPFYLLCDVSPSMGGERIAAVNMALQQMVATLQSNPLLADVAHVGVIDFADDARVVIPLTDLSEQAVSPRALSVRGFGTNYSAAFDMVGYSIQQDVVRLKEGGRVFRPTVFFLTDGVPLDAGWRQAFEKLTSPAFPFRPLFVPFGMRGADKGLLSGLVFPAGRSKLYMERPDAHAGAVITDMLEAMLTSIVSSAQSAGAGTPQVVLPDKETVGKDVEIYTADAEEL